MKDKINISWDCNDVHLPVLCAATFNQTVWYCGQIPFTYFVGFTCLFFRNDVEAVILKSSAHFPVTFCIH